METNLTLTTQKDTASTVQPPIDILPDELFGIIFTYCAPLDRDMKPSMKTSNSPWLVSQVCSRWRRIALDTPSLWANVYLDFHSIDDIAYSMKMSTNDPMVLSRFERGLAIHITLLRVQLDRSKDLPLKMRIHTYLLKRSRATAIIEELAEIMSFQSHRIQFLEISDSVLVPAMENLGYPWNFTALIGIQTQLPDHFSDSLVPIPSLATDPRGKPRKQSERSSARRVWCIWAGNDRGSLWSHCDAAAELFSTASANFYSVHVPDLDATVLTPMLHSE